MNYDEHAKAVTGRLVEMISTNETGEWVMPWRTHGLGDHLRARNATTGTAYTCQCRVGVAQIMQSDPADHCLPNLDAKVGADPIWFERGGQHRQLTNPHAISNT